MAVLEVKHIGKHFDSTRVLDDVSFDLEEGSALAIIGSSGSGKTTLLRCLNFLETPDHGSITVREETLFDADHPVAGQEKDLRTFWHGVSGVPSVSTIHGAGKCDAGGEASGEGTAGL